MKLAARLFRGALRKEQQKPESKVYESEELQQLGMLSAYEWLHIFSFVDDQALGAASCVCKSWHTLLLDERFWKQRTLRLSHTIFPSDPFSWKNCYRTVSTPIETKDMQKYFKLSNLKQGTTMPYHDWRRACCAIDKETGQKVRIKTCALDFPETNTWKQVLRRIKCVCHPHLLRTRSAFLNDKTLLHLISDWCAAPLLPSLSEPFKNIRNQHWKGEDENQVKSWVYSIVHAVAHLHSLNMYHGDLSSKKLLLNFDTNNKADKSLWRILIADFYLRQSFWESVRGCRNESPDYVAPEILEQRQGFGPHSDVWSIGVITYEL